MPTDQPTACEWTPDEDGNWTTACDEMFCFIDGGPAENKMRFCPYCGRPLKARVGRWSAQMPRRWEAGR